VLVSRREILWSTMLSTLAILKNKLLPSRPQTTKVSELSYYRSGTTGDHVWLGNERFQVDTAQFTVEFTQPIIKSYDSQGHVGYEAGRAEGRITFEAEVVPANLWQELQKASEQRAILDVWYTQQNGRQSHWKARCAGLPPQLDEAQYLVHIDLLQVVENPPMSRTVAQRMMLNLEQPEPFDR